MNGSSSHSLLELWATLSKTAMHSWDRCHASTSDVSMVMVRFDAILFAGEGISEGKARCSGGLCSEAGLSITWGVRNVCVSAIGSSHMSTQRG